MGAEPGIAGAATLAAGSLLPDIDSQHSGLGRMVKPLSGLLERKFGHRTITHSALGLLGFGVLSSWLLLIYPGVWVWLLIGVMSHILLDTANVSGVRLYARVSNSGNVAATNVQVSFYVTTPAGIGDSGNWLLLDRVRIPTIAANSTVRTDFVTWQPPAGSHTCIIVRIDHQTGELNANNNEAQENINDFDTTTNSPWSLVESEVLVRTFSNPVSSLCISGITRGCNLVITHI